MTDDLVKRLREMCGDDGILAMRDLYDTDVAAAAARIEQLQAALYDMMQLLPRSEWYFLKPETRVAIGETEDD